MNKKEKELYDSLIKSEEKYKKLWEDEKDKLSELNLEIKKLKLEIKNYEIDIDELEKQNKKLSNLDSSELEEELNELKEYIKDNSLNDVNFKLLKIQKENEVLRVEIEYKDNLLEKYQELPDIKKMLSSIQDLKVPAIDDLKDLFNLFKNDNLMNRLDEINKNINMYMEKLVRLKSIF
jgi:uncharacterized protein (DUF111 family)